MNTLETLASAQVCAFKSTQEMVDYLAANPCVRKVGRLVRQTSAPGERMALLATYASADEASAAARLADMAEEKDRKRYAKMLAGSPIEKMRAEREGYLAALDQIG